MYFLQNNIEIIRTPPHSMMLSCVCYLRKLHFSFVIMLQTPHSIYSFMHSYFLFLVIIIGARVLGFCFDRLCGTIRCINVQKVEIHPESFSDKSKKTLTTRAHQSISPPPP